MQALAFAMKDIQIAAAATGIGIILGFSKMY